MYTLGHDFIPEPIHAGGLRYHGMAPLVCQGIVEGLFEPKAYGQLKCYESAMIWAKTEGTICAPETSHAIAATIDEATWVLTSYLVANAIVLPPVQGEVLLSTYLDRSGACSTQTLRPNEGLILKG